jgi:L-rhamnose-H+ transport protein
MQVFLGVILHMLGGFASGSFYIPYKRVKGWAWESYWLVGGIFSWLIAPFVLGFLTVSDLVEILKQAPASSKWWAYFWGVLWGFGGLTFGLAMRYLGMSLGMAVALGYCAVFGTIIPPIWEGKFAQLLSTASGQTILFGLLVCVVGIIISGKAGVMKEKELSEESKKESIAEFDLKKGLLVATFSGIMSACFSFGLTAGQPIAEVAVQLGTDALYMNNAVLVLVLLGGLTTNLIWCVYLNVKNKTYTDYTNEKMPRANYLFSAIAGVTWYFQFFFYGMGDSKMGDYRFSGWTLHMAFIIVFSSLWGIYFKEWKGSSQKTMTTIKFGILAVILSTIIVGIGNYLAYLGK